MNSDMKIESLTGRRVLIEDLGWQTGSTFSREDALMLSCRDHLYYRI
jgi:hypothetical protein